jgi:hypothetical protein
MPTATATATATQHVGCFQLRQWIWHSRFKAVIINSLAHLTYLLEIGPRIDEAEVKL